MSFSRRRFLGFSAGAGVLLSAGRQAALLLAQQVNSSPAPSRVLEPWSDLPQPYPYSAARSAVALIKGDDRRKNVHDALVAIDEQIKPNLGRKRYVVIKINGVSPERQIACTHADVLHGVLDYLGPRFKGPVVIAESSARETREAYEAFGYR